LIRVSGNGEGRCIRRSRWQKCWMPITEHADLARRVAAHPLSFLAVLTQDSPRAVSSVVQRMNPRKSRAGLDRIEQ